MDLDKELNTSLLVNLKFKAKILAYTIGIILVLQLISLFYLLSYTHIFDNKIPPKILILGPTLVFIALLGEVYAYRYFGRLLWDNRNISRRFAYIITFIEITFPTVLLIFAGAVISSVNLVKLTQLLNSPPSYFYFLMILLSSLLLDFRLSCFAGILAAVEYIALSVYFINHEAIVEMTDMPMSILKALLFAVAGVIAGLVSKKIKEAVLTSLQAKDDLINKLDILVKEKTREITLQKDELAQKNKDISDSINYARRIQQAILPKEERINQMFPDHFVLYLPKDVVSGDFYWAGIKNGKKIIAAVDCTGHGVPGAFMSMVGSSLLNEIINEKGITESSIILDLLSERLIKTLQQTGAVGENKDGMDIGLCVFENNHVSFSGANNPMYHLRENSFTEIKANKQPVGIHTKETLGFTSNHVDLETGDCIYIFTDGYADQFGGSKNKKFMYKRLQDKLCEISEMPMETQGIILKECFYAWKQNFDQVDDVLIIGVRV